MGPEPPRDRTNRQNSLLVLFTLPLLSKILCFCHATWKYTILAQCYSHYRTCCSLGESWSDDGALLLVDRSRVTDLQPRTETTLVGQNQAHDKGLTILGICEVRHWLLFSANLDAIPHNEFTYDGLHAIFGRVFEDVMFADGRVSRWNFVSFPFILTLPKSPFCFAGVCTPFTGSRFVSFGLWSSRYDEIWSEILTRIDWASRKHFLLSKTFLSPFSSRFDENRHFPLDLPCFSDVLVYRSSISDGSKVSMCFKRKSTAEILALHHNRIV